MEPVQNVESGKTKDPGENVLQTPSISLWLDRYEDIFSDFDPRPFSGRALSEDFIYEAKRFSREKDSGRLELRLLMPEAKRNEADEKVIGKRLREHFRRHHTNLEKEIRDTRIKALLFIMFGFALMIGASYVSMIKSGEFLYNLLFVILEPAGWFITWFSLDQIFYTAKERKGDRDFYRKMSRCQISFNSY